MVFLKACRVIPLRMSTRRLALQSVPDLSGATILPLPREVV